MSYLLAEFTLSSLAHHVLVAEVTCTKYQLCLETEAENIHCQNISRALVDLYRSIKKKFQLQRLL